MTGLEQDAGALKGSCSAVVSDVRYLSEVPTLTLPHGLLCTADQRALRR